MSRAAAVPLSAAARTPVEVGRASVNEFRVVALHVQRAHARGGCWLGLHCDDLWLSFYS
jgi:hypothetical protein